MAHVPLVIIGGGPAGLASAIYAVRGGIDARVIEKAAPGGQVFITDRIENYPGFPEGISGPDLAERMRDQAKRLGADIVQDDVTGVDLSGEQKKVSLSRGEELTCDALIIATGSRPNQLGIPGEMEFWGRGVSYCATCDGNFFRGEPMAVIGGGDSAVQEATMLANLASEVYIIHRRDQFRAQEYLSQCAQEQSNIKVLWDTVVEEMEGDQEVRSLKLKNTRTGESSSLEVSGVFIYVGVLPATEFLEGAVELNEEGYIRAGEDGATSVSGVFAAGDVREKPARQIATAVGDAANTVKSIEIFFIRKGLSCKYV
ncbi:MAG: thioredoxin-disulfide reductase [bacterium]